MSNQGPVVQDDVITINAQHFLLPMGLLLSTIFLGIMVFLGLNNIANALEGSTLTTTATGTTAQPTVGDPTGDVPAPAPAAATSAEVGDTAAILGDRSSAKVAIIEFSDYNCSFCTRHHQQTNDQIVKEFVETGEAILVYRNFAGVGGQTTADAANAAECYREQAGDSAFFELIKKVYNTTDTRTKDMVVGFAKEALGSNTSAFDSCVSANDFADAVAADRAYAATLGINGTPGFFVGSLNADGSVDGELISGAQEFAVFKSTIEKYL